jgi:hypothetical protein
MPWWAWIGSAVLVGWSLVQVWRALTLGKINVGVLDFHKASGPAWFWFQVSVNLLLVVVFGGVAIFAVAHGVPLISN